MANKRNSKTARVLNLITHTDAEAPETAAAEPAAKPAPAAAEPSPAAPTEAVPDSPDKADAAASPPEAKPTRAKSARSRTNKKTARVSTPPEETGGNSAAAGLQPVSPPDAPTLPPAPQPVVPIVQDVRAKEQEVSEEIRIALEQEAAKLIPAESAQASAPPMPPEPKQAPQASVETAQASAEAPQKPFSDLQPVPDAHPAPVDSNIPAEIPAGIYTPHGERDVHYTNILQALVEEQAPYYIDHMLQCTCPRCVADMKAYALTNLPSKYVVLSASQSRAYMSVYAARYERELSVQMMRACVVVNENPHH